MLTPEVSKDRIDTFLRGHFASLERATEHQGQAYQRLIRIAGEVALAGGKRLRPYMSMLMYEAYTERDSEIILPTAASQEVMHLAMLVHDDIMDGDIVRHGQPNVTGRVFEAYAPFITDAKERRTRAEHSALLVGDLLVGEAFSLMEDIDGIDPKVTKDTRRLFRTAIRTVVGGQLHDAEAPFMGEEASSPRAIAHDKTAHYTFVTPLLVGATLAEAPEEDFVTLESIGEKTGIAYQLRDDILGMFGDPMVTGKSADGDLREGKRTLLMETFHSIASPVERADFQELEEKLQAGVNERTLRDMKTLLVPAKRVVEQEIDSAHKDVRALIGELSMRGEYRRALKRLVTRSLTRDH